MSDVACMYISRQQRGTIAPLFTSLLFLFFTQLVSVYLSPIFKFAMLKNDVFSLSFPSFLTVTFVVLFFLV